MNDPLADPRFLWGASTAAHQVEGGQHNQWSEWEKANAERLARRSARKLAALPRPDQIAKAAADPGNYISGQGIEHYERYEADFDLLTELNLNAFRFSIEWSRIEPEEGTWDEAALRHYAAYIDALRERGIEPVPTLWHWTVPVWFADMGGFEKQRNIRYFERFVRKATELFDDKVRYVVTINEPNAYAPLGYLVGCWPPSRKNPWLAYRVFRNLVEAHRAARRALRQAAPQLQVGIAYSFVELRPHNAHNRWNRALVRLLRYVVDWWFVAQIRTSSDFIGVNMYFTEYRDWCGRRRNPKGPLSDMGWYMEPRGLGSLSVRIWRRYHKPLLITENGLADGADTYRQWWLAETIAALCEAMTDGVQILGYLHWSLLDNFEWAEGWWPKFGLVAVDRQHGMRRTIRPSARWLAETIAALREAR